MSTTELKHNKTGERVPKGACEMGRPSSTPRPPVIKIGIVGLRFGLHILELLQSPKSKQLFSLAAVCDLREEVVQKTAKCLGVQPFTSMDELLKDDEIKVVGLFTPPTGRAQLIRKIIRAGKDVLTTKPFELDVSEAQSVLEEARELGRVIHLNSPAVEPTADLRLIGQWQSKHDLGRPIGGQATVWASYHESADGSWADDPETCPAAPLFRLGIYLLNDLNQIFGPAESIQLMTSSVRTERPTPDNAQVNIQYRNKAIGQVFASFCIDDGDPYRYSLALHFERGSIYRNMGNIQNAEPQTAELMLVKQMPTGRQILEHSKVPELTGDYNFDALSHAIHSRRMLSDAYIAQIVECVRLVDALKRAQPNGMVCV